MSCECWGTDDLQFFSGVAPNRHKMNAPKIAACLIITNPCFDYFSWNFWSSFDSHINPRTLHLPVVPVSGAVFSLTRKIFNTQRYYGLCCIVYFSGMFDGRGVLATISLAGKKVSPTCIPMFRKKIWVAFIIVFCILWKAQIMYHRVAN